MEKIADNFSLGLLIWQILFVVFWAIIIFILFILFKKFWKKQREN